MMNQPSIVVYLLDGAPRIRTFPNNVIMKRWIEKFNRENYVNEHTHIDAVITGAETIRVHNDNLRLVKWGES